MNKKNKISTRAALRALLGVIGITKHNSLGHMGNLNTLLRKFISPLRFEKYQKSDKTFVAYVGYIEAKSGARKYVNLKETDYETAIQSIIASASIPVFTKPVHINGDIGVDGGVRDHIGTPWALDNHNITRTLSIYSRDADLTDHLNRDWEDKNVFDILMRSMDIMLMEVSKSDERIEDEICKRKRIAQKKIFLPKIMDGFYDVDLEKLDLLYQAGVRNAQNELNKPW